MVCFIIRGWSICVLNERVGVLIKVCFFVELGIK